MGHQCKDHYQWKALRIYVNQTTRHPSLMIQALWNFAEVGCHLYWRVVVRVECSAGSALLPPPPTAASTATACTKLLHIIFQRPGPRSRAPPAWPQPAPPPSHAAFSTQLLSQARAGEGDAWKMCGIVQMSEFLFYAQKWFHIVDQWGQIDDQKRH